MKTGDRITMIHEPVQGVVLRVLPGDELEFEDQYGFVRRIKKSEAAPIHAPVFGLKDEGLTTGNASSEKDLKPTKTGIFLVRSASSELYILNNTEHEILVNVFISQGSGVLHGLGKCILPQTSERLNRQNMLFDMVYIQCLRCIHKAKEVIPVIEKTISRIDLLKSIHRVKLDGFDQLVHAVQLDELVIDIDTEKLEHSIKSNQKTSAHTIKLQVADSIDLHEEPLLGKNHGLNASQIFEKQKEAFMFYMENVLAVGIDRIRVIHGTGNGRLRNFVHEQLKKNKSVKNFKLVDEHRLGAGVTEVEFR